MNDQSAGQQQEAQNSPRRANGNGSQPSSTATEIPLPKIRQSSTPKRAKVELIDKASINKSTGPRTPQGKERSKFNARKHGLFSKAVLLKDESRAEYDALLKGLMEDLQPQGKLESLLVEEVATLMWRKRRLLQAEVAEIGKAQFVSFDLELQNRAGDLEYAQLRDSSDANLRQSNTRNLLRDAIEILDLHRLLFAVDEGEAVESMRRTLNLMYGCEEEGPRPYRWRQASLMLSKFVSEVLAKKQESKDQPNVRQIIVEAISKEIMRLAELHNAAVEIEELKRNHNRSGPHVPLPEVSDRLVRYEAHLSREIDRILNRLERLQRMRKGQPLPPQVDVSIS